MSRRTLLFVSVYSVTAAAFVILLLFFATASKDYAALRHFSRLSGVSDAAFYSNNRALRFYSFSKAEDLWNDPFLPPRSSADFVYRMRK